MFTFSQDESGRPQVQDLGTPSLFQRWLWAGNLAVAAILVALVASFLAQERAAHHERAAVATRNLSLLLEQNIGALLAKTDVSLQTVAREVARQSSRGPLDGHRLDELLAEQDALLPEVIGLRISDALGRVAYGEPGQGRGAAIAADRRFFVQARDHGDRGLIIDGPFQSRLSGQWILVLARRLEDGQGRFLGTVSAAIPADHFRRLFSAMDLGRQGSITLRDADFRLISRYTPDDAPQEIGSDKAPPRFAQSVKANPRTGSYPAKSAFDGIERWITYQRIGDHPLYIIAGLATEEYLGPWRQSALRTGGLAALAILVMVLSSAMIQRLWRRQGEAILALRRSERAAEEAHALLQEAVDSLDIGFAIYDAEDRLVVCNDACRDFYGPVRDLVVPGARFEDLLRESVTRGLVPANGGDGEAWIAARLRHHGEADGKPLQMDLDDGRHLLILKQRTPRGYVVGSWVDVTELERYRLHLEQLVEARTAELQASMAQFRILVEQAPTAIAMLDREFRYVAASRRWLLDFALDGEALIGRNHYEVHPDLPERWREHHRLALAGQPQEREQDVWERSDGRRQWTRWAVYPWRDEHGDIGGIIIYAEDISARKAVEERLLESEIRFRSTFEQAAVGLAHIGLDGRALRVNDKLCALLGYSREELLAQDVKTISHPEDMEADLALALDLVAGSRPSYSLEKRYIRKDGTLVWANLTVALVRDAAGEPDYFIAVVEDIQARKETEAALAAARESHRRNLEQQVAERTADLLAANRELQGFIHAASHDMRGPLGRINSFGGLLEKHCRERLSEDGAMFLDIIRGNANRLLVLIDDLLHHTLIENKILARETVDVGAVVAAVLAGKEAAIRERGAELSLDLPDLRLEANAYGLTEVLDKLVDNAIKFSSPGAAPRLEIGGRTEGDNCRLWVRDKGIGFAMVYHDRIFELFRRLETYEQFPGSGVGLALVKKTMERMGGRVWAESAPGQGATFFLELPLAREEVSV